MISTKLENLQENFASELSGQKTDSEIQIIPAGKLSQTDALNVYKRAYIARLTEALGETYEAIWRVLGDEDFFRVTKLYISQTTSQSYNLSDYGSSFPNFLNDEYGHEFSFIADLARFELSFKQIFHSKQHQPISSEIILKLTNIESVQFTFGSATLLFEANHSVYDLWKLRKELKIDLDSLSISVPEKILLYKLGDKIYTYRFNSDGQFSVLKNLFDGKNILEAVEKCAFPLNNEDLSALFKTLVETGVIIGVTNG